MIKHCLSLLYIDWECYKVILSVIYNLLNCAGRQYNSAESLKITIDRTQDRIHYRFIVSLRFAIVGRSVSFKIYLFIYHQFAFIISNLK